jgi:hypothetical protein
MSPLGTELKMAGLPETGGERTFGRVGSITEFDPGCVKTR